MPRISVNPTRSGIHKLVAVICKIEAQQRVRSRDLIPDLILLNLIEKNAILVFAQQPGEFRILFLEQFRFSGKQNLIGQLVNDRRQRDAGEAMWSTIRCGS